MTKVLIIGAGVAGLSAGSHLQMNGYKEISDVGITIHNFDPTAAPIGKTVLTMMMPVHNTEYWVKLRNENRAEYNQKKGHRSKNGKIG
jgi:thioredoxin reductase